MKWYVAVLITFISTNAFSQEPPFSYGQFGFKPAEWEGPKLSESQKKDLDSCVSEASQQTGVSKEDREKMNSL